ncbi:MAG: inorganic phosphate transporter [Thermoplasmatota archaeon]
MVAILALLGITVLLAVIFDFLNGFHDSANAISTVVATRVLRPWQALIVAGAANFIGPFVFGVAVAKAVQTDLLDKAFPAVSDPHSGLVLVAAALVGAIAWNIITWRGGIPSSSSHALLGGIIGAGIAAAGAWQVVKWPHADQLWIFAKDVAVAIPLGAIVGWAYTRATRGSAPTGLVVGAYLGLTVASIWVVLPGTAATGHADLRTIGKTILFMAVSPFLGMVVAYLATLALMATFRRMEQGRVNRTFGVLQVFSSAFYSLTHGTNDGQKTMGVIAGALTVAAAPHFFPGGHFVSQGADSGIPVAVVLVAATAIGLGTMFGGWRIVRTMATKITSLQPYQGFAAETGGGVALFFMAQQGIPVSTTHAISGSIMGVGATRQLSAVQWGTARRIMIAWLLTIPAAAAMGALFEVILRILL